MAAAIFGPLADAGINVDMIVQNVDEIGKVTDMTFTVTKADLDRTVKALEAAKSVLQYKELTADKGVAKVSIVGVGMRSHAGIAQTMFQTLAEKKINILVISTSEIKVSVLISDDYTELAVRALHAAFELEGENWGHVRVSAHRNAVETRHRFIGQPICHHGRGDELGVRASSGGGACRMRAHLA